MNFGSADHAYFTATPGGVLHLVIRATGALVLLPVMLGALR
jgi:hypothetical protein